MLCTAQCKCEGSGDGKASLSDGKASLSDGKASRSI
jgi:hypothetical protein